MRYFRPLDFRHTITRGRVWTIVSAVALMVRLFEQRVESKELCGPHCLST